MKTITTWVLGLGLLSLPLAPSSFAESPKGKTGDKTLESGQQSGDRTADRSMESDQGRSQGTYPGLEHFPSQGTGQQSAEQERAAGQRQAEGMRGQAEGMRTEKPQDTDGASTDKSKATTKPGETDITNTKGAKGAVPDKYTVMPVARGKKIEVNSEMVGSTVQNQKGETIGTLEQLIMDSETRKVEYAMISIGDTDRLRAFPWSAFKVDKQSGNVVLNVTKEQLQGVSGADQSPDISAIEQQLQTLRQQESQKGERPGLGVTKQPAIAGPHGETEVGGGGPSGDRALPPAENAPSFKGGK